MGGWGWGGRGGGVVWVWGGCVGLDCQERINQRETQIFTAPENKPNTPRAHLNRAVADRRKRGKISRNVPNEPTVYRSRYPNVIPKGLETRVSPGGGHASPIGRKDEKRSGGHDLHLVRLGSKKWGSGRPEESRRKVTFSKKSKRPEERERRDPSFRRGENI